MIRTLYIYLSHLEEEGEVSTHLIQYLPYLLSEFSVSIKYRLSVHDI